MKHDCYILLNNTSAEGTMRAAHEKHSGISGAAHPLFYLLAALISILSFSGCTEYLGENPDNRIELNVADDYYATLTGAYPEAWHLFTELMTDNYRYYDYTSWNSGTLVSWLKPYYLWSDEYILNLPVGPEFAWGNYYRSIYAANVVLEGIDNAQGDETFKQSIKGEALLVRAYCHFMLVNLFAVHFNEATAVEDLGIPYVIETEKEGIVHYQRDNLAFVYDRIEEDALQGIQLLGNYFSDFPKYHFTKEAAYAFLSRLYLYKSDWEKCIEYSNLALQIKSTVRNLVEDYNTYFELNDFEGFRNDYFSSGKENILLMNKTLEWISYPATGFYANEFRTEFLSGDLRGGLFVFNDNTNLNWHSLKFIGQFKDGQQFSNVALFTVEEVLLNRAEALVRKQDPDIVGALNDLNSILESRYEVFNPLTFSMFSGSETQVLERIVDERRYELCYEGFRWFDLKRFNKPVEHDNAGVTLTLSGDDLRYVIQIPDKELSVNELMVANPR
jgi:hypothetical protein